MKLICYKSASPQYDAKAFDFDDYIILEGRFDQKLKQLRSVIRDFSPHVLHSVLFEANMLGRFARLFFPKLVHIESLVNEMYSNFRLADPRVSAAKLKLYQIFDFITGRIGTSHFHANGESVAAHYKEKLKISGSKITVIPRGRNVNPFVNDTEIRSQLRREIGIADDVVVVVHVGRHEFQKGQDILIKAVNKLKDQNAIFLLAGREGNITNEIHAWIQEYSLSNKIVLLGHRNDVSKLLAASDAFVFPSRFEGLPGALIEAEAAGLPIIASDIPNNREVAEEGKNALYFGLDNVDALTSQLHRVISDRDLRTAMAEESLKIFRANFSLENVHHRMEEMLIKLVSRQ